MTPRIPVDRAVLFAIAAKASADPRSVQKELLRPGSVRGMAGARVRRTLAEAGLGGINTTQGGERR